MKKIRKIIALISVFAILLSTCAYAKSFDDVAKNHPYYKAIDELSNKGIITGDDSDGNGKMSFRSYDYITRAEVSTIACRLLDYKSLSQTRTSFTDVPSSHWASGYIAKIEALGIVNGYGDGKFGPEDDITYEQAVKIFVEIAGYSSYAKANGGYPNGYIKAAEKYKLTDGLKNDNGSRGVIAQLAYNTMNFMNGAGSYDDDEYDSSDDSYDNDYDYDYDDKDDNNYKDDYDDNYRDDYDDKSDKDDDVSKKRMYSNALHIDEGEEISCTVTFTTFDETWYTFKITEDSTVTLNCVNSSNQNIFVSIMSKDGSAEIASRYGSNKMISPSAYLEPGRYYIKISTNGYGSGKINFDLSYSTTTPTYDKDNKKSMYATPNELSLGETKEGHLGYTSDKAERNEVDWYKFTLYRSTLITLNAIITDDLVADMHLYKSDGTSSIERKLGGDQKFIISKQLEPGDYYVKLEKGDPYSFGVTAGSYQISLSGDGITANPNSANKNDDNDNYNSKDEPAYTPVRDDSYAAIIDEINSDSVDYFYQGKKYTAEISSALDCKDDLEDAQQGDIWRFSVEDDVIVDAKELISVDTKGRDIEIPGKSGELELIYPNNNTSGRNDTWFFGPAVKYKSKKISIAYADSRGNYDLSDNINIYAEGAYVYVYDPMKKNNRIYVGNASDVYVDENIVKNENGIETDEGYLDAGEQPLGMLDFVAAIAYDDEILDVVIYKAYEFDYDIL